MTFSSSIIDTPEYQTPVQKAVESLIIDIARSVSAKDIIDFINFD